MKRVFRCYNNGTSHHQVNATRTEKLVKDLGNCREENRELNSTEQVRKHVSKSMASL